jgi:hypothetical protein
MLAKLKALRQIYQDETRFDWVVLVADVFGLGIVLFAFASARVGASAPELANQIASVQF